MMKKREKRGYKMKDRKQEKFIELKEGQYLQDMDK